MKKRIPSNIEKKILIVITLLFLMSAGTNLQAFVPYQENQSSAIVSFVEYSGKVVDDQTKAPLVFAVLSLEGTNISTVTNTEGAFLLKIPENITNGSVSITFLGYDPKTIPISQFEEVDNLIGLHISVTELSEVNVSAPKNAEALLREVLAKKVDNYFDDPTLMTAFYRETIRKRRKNVSLSEAVVNIYKTPYTSGSKDVVKLYKARKSTDYNKLDTLALKLQGGPFNTLFGDIMKYPEYIFTDETIPNYRFTFESSTRINNKLIYVIGFHQRHGIVKPLYSGKLYIDAQDKILTSAIYSLNITDKTMAARKYIKKKPAEAEVWPTEVAYRVDYREKDGKWYYGYSNILMKFKIDWDKRLFNSVYTMNCEMAVTDWKKNPKAEKVKYKEKLKPSVILSDMATGFSDPDFWGEYNIIEPEKSIESAIRKIQRQLRKSISGGGESAP